MFENIQKAILATRYYKPTMECKVERFIVKVKPDRKDNVRIVIERGYDSIGISLDVTDSVFEQELECFLYHAQQWHNANPVRERETLGHDYQRMRRMSRENRP